jgi:hypothetical protein
MAQDGCSRKEAQGNMDAYIENPNGTFHSPLQVTLFLTDVHAFT